MPQTNLEGQTGERLPNSARVLLLAVYRDDSQSGCVMLQGHVTRDAKRNAVKGRGCEVHRQTQRAGCHKRQKGRSAQITQAPSMTRR